MQAGRHLLQSEQAAQLPPFCEGHYQLARDTISLRGTLSALYDASVHPKSCVRAQSLPCSRSYPFLLSHGAGFGVRDGSAHQVPVIT